MKDQMKKGTLILILSHLLLLINFSIAWAANPIVTHIYTADPAPIIYDGRFYIFCGHDEGGETGGWIMREWRILSSIDLVNWTDHGAALRVSDVSWLNTDQAWASQCVERNGRFYFYICDSGEIGVATSNNILGPYNDALGRPLISNQTPGACPGDDNIDPTVFIDDDGQAYIYWGTDRVVRQARLNNDMISIQGEITVPQGLNRFFEASWVHKYNGLYYYSYAAYNDSGDNWPSNIDYATSDNPMGPWTYHGTLNGPAGVGTNHPGIIEYMGQWFFVYHTDYLSGGIAWQRSVSIEYLYYNSDGTIRPIIQTTEGVGPITTTPEPTTADCGDVNNSGTVDIVDALLVAQYYVGLNPQGFDSTNADVNGDGSISIVDALLIAQLYVGLIYRLEC